LKAPRASLKHFGVRLFIVFVYLALLGNPHFSVWTTLLSGLSLGSIGFAVVVLGVGAAGVYQLYRRDKHEWLNRAGIVGFVLFAISFWFIGVPDGAGQQWLLLMIASVILSLWTYGPNLVSLDQAWRREENREARKRS
jgi:amino acid transporter